MRNPVQPRIPPDPGLAAARQGDLLAFNHLVREHLGSAYNHAYHLLSDEDAQNQ